MIYTPKIKEYILNNYQGKSNIDLAKEVSTKFNVNCNNVSISNFKINMKRRHGISLNTGINAGCYPKGNVPLNKGTKGMFNVGGNRTSFKKGNTPINYRPVGSERINVDGYIEIKIKDPNKWDLKHRVVYKQLHGDIPKGSVIIFADSNKLNLDPDNLIMISQRQNAFINHQLKRSTDKDITATSIMLSEVIIKQEDLLRAK